MKYSKPEIEIKDIILPPIASNQDSWLDAAKDSITDSYVDRSW